MNNETMDIFDTTESRYRQEVVENKNRLREVTLLLDNLVDQPPEFQRAVRKWLFHVPKQCYGINSDKDCGRPVVEGSNWNICEQCQWEHWEAYPPAVSPSQQRTLDKIEVICKELLLTEEFFSTDLVKKLKPLWKVADKKGCYFRANKLYEKYHQEFKALQENANGNDS
jgi:hypothetical protein